MFFKKVWRYFSESSLQIGPETFRRFVGDLDTVLENRNWETLGGHWTQEESEVLVNFFRFFRHFFNDFFKRQHPRCRQVAILKKTFIFICGGKKKRDKNRTCKKFAFCKQRNCQIKFRNVGTFWIFEHLCRFIKETFVDVWTASVNRTTNPPEGKPSHQIWKRLGAAFLPLVLDLDPEI